MKLLQIISVLEYKSDVVNILKHSGVHAFSYHSVQGVKNDVQREDRPRFVSTPPAAASILFSVFIENGCERDIFERIDEFNSKLTTKSKIHIACLQVEQSNF